MMGLNSRSVATTATPNDSSRDVAVRKNFDRFSSHEDLTSSATHDTESSLSAAAMMLASSSAAASTNDSSSAARRSTTPTPRALLSSSPPTTITSTNINNSLQNVLQNLINQHGTDAFESACSQMGFLKHKSQHQTKKNDDDHPEWECGSTSTGTDASSSITEDDDGDDDTISKSSFDGDSSIVGSTTSTQKITKAIFQHTKRKIVVPSTQKEAKAILRQGQSLLKKSTKETLTQLQIAQGVMDASFDPEFTMNEKGIVLAANHAAEDLFGWPKQDLVGKSILDTVLQHQHQGQEEFIPKHVGKRLETVATCKDTTNTNTVVNDATRVKATTRTTVPVELGVSEIQTPKGKIYCVFMHDLTRRQKSDAEKKLKNDIAQGIMEASFDPELTMKCDGTIQTTNHATEILFGYSKNQLMGKHICTILPLVENNDNLNHFLTSHLGNRTEVLAKHLSGTEIPIELGVTEIEISCKATGDSTTNNEGDIDDNSRIFCVFMHDLTRRKKNECLIQKRKRQVESVLEASFDPDFTIGANGKIQNANHAAEDLFGYTKDEMIGQNLSLLLPDQGTMNDFLEENVGKPSEHVVLKKDGHHVDVEMGITAIDNNEANDDEKVLFCVVMHDLTRRKKRMRIAEGVMEASFDPELTMTCKGIVESANHAAEELFGWSKGELIGHNIQCLFPSVITTDDPETLQSFIQNHLGEKRQELVACCKQTGKDVPIELGLTKIETGNEEDHDEEDVIYCLFMHDLTRRKTSDAEKLRRRNIAEGVMEASFDPEFTFTTDGMLQTANHAAEELFGWKKGELVGKNIDILFGDVDNWQLGRFIETHLNQRLETIAYTCGGSEVPVEVGLTEIQTVGDEKMYCLFIHDLTRRRKNQEALARKQRITEGIVEASFDPMIGMDDSGSIVMVNKATCREFGWSREELLEEDISKILFCEHSKKPYHFLKHYTKTWIKNTAGSQREMEARRRNGERFPIMLGLSEVDCKGNDHLYIAFIQDLSDQKKLIETEIEKAQAESLLLNMLPENIANRLKDDPSHIAEKFASTTILFADIVGFTALSSLMSPVQTVKMLNDLFSRFDDLLDSYQLNKVKTIGDCYMATSVPGAEKQAESCASICRYAIDILAAVKAFNKENPGMNIELRLGINTGPVVAGVVGTKRFLYDLWGDAVNMASRMESTGMPNRIQVSKEVVDLLRTLPTNDIVIESRGKVLIKGKGDIETFWLTSQKTKQSDSAASGLQRKRMRRTSCPIIKGL